MRHKKTLRSLIVEDAYVLDSKLPTTTAIVVAFKCRPPAVMAFGHATMSPSPFCVLVQTPTVCGDRVGIPGGWESSCQITNSSGHKDLVHHAFHVRIVRVIRPTHPMRARIIVDQFVGLCVPSILWCGPVHGSGSRGHIGPRGRGELNLHLRREAGDACRNSLAGQYFHDARSILCPHGKQ
jgi:hypothetical protein